MAVFTEAQLQEHADKMVEVFKDGFQIADLFEIVPKLMEIVDTVEGMSGPEKALSVEALIDIVLKKTDTPYLPDGWTDGILASAFKKLIPVIAKATKGEFEINKSDCGQPG